MLFFGKKKNEVVENFVMGVEDTFKLINSDDIIAVGKVKGKVKVGSAIYISNLGDDDTPVSLSTVLGIEINGKAVSEAADTKLAVKVENGSKLSMKTGSVLFTREASQKDVHSAYINALGDGYISFKHMELTKEDYDKMSLTDFAEVRRLYKFLIESRKEQETDEIREYNQKVMNAIGGNMCAKILQSKEIYVVVDKKTGEPHMLSRTYIDENDNFVTTPPDIMLITKAYFETWKTTFSPDRFELLKIENGQDGKGIYNFLGSTFYLNGACGVQVLFNDFSIDAAMLVEKPDYSKIENKASIPVTNPDLERWLLLYGQLDEAKTEQEKQLHSAYMGHIFRELATAKFIVPMKVEGQVTANDDKGSVTFNEGTKLALASRKGKGDKDAVEMFTDWKRFYMCYKAEDGFSGMIQPISGMIETFDCAINATKYLTSGCYVDKDFYETHIKQFEEKTE